MSDFARVLGAAILAAPLLLAQATSGSYCDSEQVRFLVRDVSKSQLEALNPGVLMHDGYNGGLVVDLTAGGRFQLSPGHWITIPGALSTPKIDTSAAQQVGNGQNTKPAPVPSNDADCGGASRTNTDLRRPRPKSRIGRPTLSKKDTSTPRRLLPNTDRVVSVQQQVVQQQARLRVPVVTELVGCGIVAALLGVFTVLLAAYIRARQLDRVITNVRNEFQKVGITP
jgi:hypothetical protein